MDRPIDLDWPSKNPFLAKTNKNSLKSKILQIFGTDVKRFLKISDFKKNFFEYFFEKSAKNGEALKLMLRMEKNFANMFIKIKSLVE